MSNKREPLCSITSIDLLDYIDLEGIYSEDGIVCNELELLLLGYANTSFGKKYHSFSVTIKRAYAHDIDKVILNFVISGIKKLPDEKDLKEKRRQQYLKLKKEFENE
jgi:hypothetical protein